MVYGCVNDCVHTLGWDDLKLYRAKARVVSKIPGYYGCDVNFEITEVLDWTHIRDSRNYSKPIESKLDSADGPNWNYSFCFLSDGCINLIITDIHVEMYDSIITAYKTGTVNAVISLFNGSGTGKTMTLFYVLLRLLADGFGVTLASGMGKAKYYWYAEKTRKLMRLHHKHVEVLTKRTSADDFGYFEKVALEFHASAGLYEGLLTNNLAPVYNFLIDDYSSSERGEYRNVFAVVSKPAKTETVWFLPHLDRAAVALMRKLIWLDNYTRRMKIHQVESRYSDVVSPLADIIDMDELYKACGTDLKLALVSTKNCSIGWIYIPYTITVSSIPTCNVLRCCTQRIAKVLETSYRSIFLYKMVRPSGGTREKNNEAEQPQQGSPLGMMRKKYVIGRNNLYRGITREFANRFVQEQMFLRMCRLDSRSLYEKARGGYAHVLAVLCCKSLVQKGIRFGVGKYFGRGGEIVYAYNRRKLKDVINNIRRAHTADITTEHVKMRKQQELAAEPPVPSKHTAATDSEATVAAKAVDTQESECESSDEYSECEDTGGILYPLAYVRDADRGYEKRKEYSDITCDRDHIIYYNSKPDLYHIVLFLSKERLAMLKSVYPGSITSGIILFNVPTRGTDMFTAHRTTSLVPSVYVPDIIVEVRLRENFNADVLDTILLYNAGALHAGARKATPDERRRSLAWLLSPKSQKVISGYGMFDQLKEACCCINN